MARYTTQLRTICESESGLLSSTGYNGIEQVVTSAIPKIFNFSFPIFDENYRTPLCRKILKHFYMREICCETYGLWKLMLDNKLNEIMPYYNQLYKSTLLEFDPLHDTDLTTSRTGGRDSTSHSATTGSKVGHGEETENRKETVNSNIVNDGTVNGTTNNTNTTDGTVNSTNTNTSTTNGTEWTLFNDTPQGGLTGIETWKYLTTATKKTNQSTTNASGSNDEVSHSEATSDGSNEEVSHNETASSGTNEADIARENDNTLTENSESNTTANTTEDYLTHVFGKRGIKTNSAMLMEYRKTFVNVDAEIIKALEPLFFGLWE